MICLVNERNTTVLPCRWGFLVSTFNGVKQYQSHASQSTSVILIALSIMGEAPRSMETGQESCDEQTWPSVPSLHCT